MNKKAFNKLVKEFGGWEEFGVLRFPADQAKQEFVAAVKAAIVIEKAKGAGK